MREDALGRRQARGHQEGRPVDGVEADDVLADEVDVGRPPLGEGGPVLGVAGGGDVVGQRIQPDIHYMCIVARHLHAPAEAGAADREVAEARLHEGDHLVPPAGRRDEVGVRLVEGQQLLLPGGEAEEVRGLAHPLHRSAGGGVFHAVALCQLVRAVEGLVAHRVPALVMAEIDLALRGQSLPQGRAGALVAGLGGADEVGDREAHGAGQVAEMLADPVGEGLRVLAGVVRRLLHLLAVLVGAGEEEHLPALQPPPAR
jgi:hypothetical protein